MDTTAVWIIIAFLLLTLIWGARLLRSTGSKSKLDWFPLVLLFVVIIGIGIWWIVIN